MCQFASKLPDCFPIVDLQALVYVALLNALRKKREWAL
jgi:hypothetical protein